MGTNSSKDEDIKPEITNLIDIKNNTLEFTSDEYEFIQTYKSMTLDDFKNNNTNMTIHFKAIEYQLYRAYIAIGNCYYFGYEVAQDYDLAIINYQKSIY